MNRESDIRNHERGLVRPLDTLLNNRYHKAGDFLARVNDDRENYEKAAESLGVDMPDMERKLALLVEKAKKKAAKKKTKD